MRKLFLLFALTVGLLTSASTLQAQTVNMSRYITLTVNDGAHISLRFCAAAEGTPVRIVSGSNTQDITVGTSWTGTATYTADGTTMTIYGDITDFICDDNGANLTALDPSHNTQLETLDCGSNTLSSLDVSNNTQLKKLWCCENKLNSLDVSGCTQLTGLRCRDNQLTDLDVSGCTQLEELWCYNNNFTTAALDDIYCALPDRTGKENGQIEPVYSDTSSNHAIVLATNKANAIAKNWKVQYYNNTDIPATSGSYVCGTPHPEPNMNSYITLTVNDGAHISLRFCAAAEGTPVRIVSGSNTQDITVGTSWTGTATYTADGTTMTIYGDITDFICSDNGANLTALDPSHNTELESLSCRDNLLSSLDVSNNTQLKKLWCCENKLNSLDVSGCTQLTTLRCSSNTLTSLDVSGCTQLEELWCYNNNFTTAALDDIYCALPDRTGKENGQIEPVYSDTSSNHAIVLATNKANAIAKNWKVQYYNNTDIPATTGSYVCSAPEPNMNSYITLTVTNGAAIKLDLKAASAGTPIRIVSGSNTQDITVGTGWYGTAPYTADGTTMTVYGNLIGFDCSENGASLTAIDPSHNTQLTSLDCGSNTLSSLDVSGCTQLTELYCYSNSLSSLDVSHNTQLTELSCSSNKLSSLEISHNTQLTELYCYSNSLSSLDVSHNTQLTELYCYDNKFTTATLDDIYCALPVRQASDNARIQPVYSDTSSNHAVILATNKANAIAKNWKVQYYKDDTDIPATTGTYECGTPHTDIAEATAEQALTLYPNPVADVLYLSATARTIRIYNVYGIEVAHATDIDRVEVSHLPAGVYTVKADGTVAKMVKR